ncbi:MAG: rane bound O-acyl transferase, family protein [Bryobacterales bacterium]|nr:rane bound O-acyl transferase, family protein [Bryobacterales bacterium]
MLFTTLQFAIFLAVVLGLHYALPKPARRYLLLAASLYFYMAWNPKFVVLILLLITIDFFAAKWIVSRAGPARRMALMLSLAANIGLLGWFKYANFFRETWLNVAHPGAPVVPMDIILPLGISFHTFQSISYVIDVYRGEQAVIESYVDYSLFVAFFPQLVAGPIVRAKEFFHDYFNWSAPTAQEWHQGVYFILTGLVKKMVFADRFAMVADAYFANPQAMPGLLQAWSGTIAFGLQIFFDFSGYTDIAIGVALLFGYHFPENFRRPYLAASVTEFWRRWHITLSSWLRDYIYISLGGNRRGSIRTWANLMATMLLGGLWHGASWNFVIWGGFHGAVLAVERVVWGRGAQRGLARIPLTVVTFLIVNVGWVFFRAKGLPAALFVLREMFAGVAGTSLLTGANLWLALAALGVALAEEYGQALGRLANGPVWVRTTAAVLALLALELFTASDLAIPFVYFQF